jgi:hypothetical protein
VVKNIIQWYTWYSKIWLIQNSRDPKEKTVVWIMKNLYNLKFIKKISKKFIEKIVLLSSVWYAVPSRHQCHKLLFLMV